MEKINTNRLQGDPLEFTIDLKWSLWTTSPEYWGEYAPKTYLHLKAGFDGDFDEHGDTIVIYTAPRKEIRYGTIIIDPKRDEVRVLFRAEFDEDPPLYMNRMLRLPSTLDEFLKLIGQVEEELLQVCS